MRQLLGNFVAAMLTTIGLNAHAWTVTETGIIGYGVDQANVFNTVNPKDLSGIAFALSITADPSLYSMPCLDGSASSCAGQYSNYAQGYNTGDTLISLTINGIMKSWTIFASDTYDNNQGVASLFNASTQLGYRGFWGVQDIVAQMSQTAGSFSASDGSYLVADEYVRVANHPTGLSLDYDQVWSYIPTDSDYQSARLLRILPTSLLHIVVEGGQFVSDAAQLGNRSVAGGKIDCIAINSNVCAPVDTNNVPEPGSLALVLAGLGIIGTIARRKKAVS